jgi:hypothetical protein
MTSRWLLALAAALPLTAQTIDFKFLDKLGDKAKESSVVNLGPEQLGMLSGLTGGEGKNLGEAAKALKSIQVRSFEFDQSGQYDVEEVRAFRDKVKASGDWVSLVSVKEKGGFTEIMYLKGTDGKSKGMLIVAAEPREVSVVHIDGPLDLSSLGKLGGIMGIPEITGGHGSRKEPPAPPAPPKKPGQEDEDNEL